MKLVCARSLFAFVEESQIRVVLSLTRPRRVVGGLRFYKHPYFVAESAS